MIFEQEYIIFEILDVFFLDQINSKPYNSNRNYDSISMRFEADTVIETENSSFHLSDNAICFASSKINYTRIAKRDVLVAINFKVLNYRSFDFEYYVPKDANKYRVLFEKILDCWKAKEPAYKNECSGILNKIFAELYKENVTEDVSENLYPAIQYIKKTFLSKDFSLSTAAEKAFMSETYFRKLFRDKFGISPKKYIIERRMAHAQALILTNYYSLQEVSDLCGYNDYKHFSVEFKKFTGISPSQYDYDRESKNHRTMGLNCFEKSTKYIILRVYFAWKFR